MLVKEINARVLEMWFVDLNYSVGPWLTLQEYSAYFSEAHVLTG